MFKNLLDKLFPESDRQKQGRKTPKPKSPRPEIRPKGHYVNPTTRPCPPPTPNQRPANGTLYIKTAGEPAAPRCDLKANPHADKIITKSTKAKREESERRRTCPECEYTVWSIDHEDNDFEYYKCTECRCEWKIEKNSRI